MTSDIRSILVTGGAGYIATHTVVELAAAGYHPVLLDNLSNSKREAVCRVEKIIGRTLPFYEADVRDRAALRAVFEKHSFQGVIHFAGLKSVGESVAQPLRYYDNNVSGTIALCEVMAEFGVRELVFSSSATVYGEPASVPVREDSPVGATTNPYGRSKFIVEQILTDLALASYGIGSPSVPTVASAKVGGGRQGESAPGWRIALLRYFNPVGAHASGTIGEDPAGVPNNLMPYVAQVAVGKRSFLNVFGSDYPTADGTGVRDYIHVVDLAQGHVAALGYLESHSGVVAVNLGTGRGYSVLEMIRAFEKASGKKVPFKVAARRPGDVATCYADPSLAKRLFGWQATRGIDEMCTDVWKWQQQNPEGY